MTRIDRLDLIGTWTLERWELVYADGRAPECPLGADAVGLLMYTPDGFVSASLARAHREPNTPRSADEKIRAFDDYFAYAGRFDLREDNVVVHRIAMALHPGMKGVDSLRHAVIEGDRLTLSGPDFRRETEVPRSHRIVWRRARLG